MSERLAAIWCAQVATNLSALAAGKFRPPSAAVTAEEQKRTKEAKGLGSGFSPSAAKCSGSLLTFVSNNPNSPGSIFLRRRIWVINLHKSLLGLWLSFHQKGYIAGGGNTISRAAA